MSDRVETICKLDNIGPPAKKRKRVIRTIVTEGERDWVNTVIARSRLGGVGAVIDMSPIGTITCTALTVEID